MSDFNTANDLASQLVWGCHYRSNEPCFKLTKIIFHRGLGSDDNVVIENDRQTDWAEVAARIQALLGRGYEWVAIPCEYCGATELEDVLHCHDCGEPILHGASAPASTRTASRRHIAMAATSLRRSPGW
jgi:hypothetical protein